MAAKNPTHDKVHPPMISIYLVRHAIAAERGPEWPDDTKRPLTHKGAARMREVVEGLVALGIEFDLVITSPLVRAKQTADLLIAGLPDKPALVISKALEPDRTSAEVAEELARHTKARRIALVGHEPSIGKLGAWLIGAKKPLVFKKGGVCQIDFPTLPLAGPGQLVWHATPKMLRALDA